MTTYTIFSGAADGQVEAVDSDYATARAGAGLSVDTNITDGDIGQAPGFNLNVSYFGFDTSVVDDAETVSSAVLSLYVASDNSTDDFTVQARLYDWGATLTSADWRDGTDMAGDTLLATVGTASISDGAYADFASEAAFVSAINKTGTTRLYVANANQAAGVAPTNSEKITVVHSDETGTSQDPRLVVITTPSDVTLSIPLGTLTLTALAPQAAVDRLVQIPAGLLALSGRVPTVQVIDGQVLIDSASLALSAFAPSLAIDRLQRIPLTSMTLAAQTPTVSVLATLLDIPSTRMTLTAIAPAAAGALWNPTIPANTIWTPVPLAD